MDTLKPEKVTRAECTRSPDCGKLLKGFNAEYFCPSDHFIVANSEELAQEELLAKMSTTCELCGKEAPLARWSWGSACFVRLEAVLLEGEKGKLEFHCPPWETSDKKDAIVWSLIRYRDVRENFLSLIATTTSLSREEFASLERPKEEKEKDRKNLEEKAAKERKEWDRRYEEGVEGVNVITAEMEERRKEKEAIFEREGSRNNFLGNKIPSRMGLIHRKLNGDKIEKEQAHQESHEVHDDLQNLIDESKDFIDDINDLVRNYRDDYEKLEKQEEELNQDLSFGKNLFEEWSGSDSKIAMWFSETLNRLEGNAHSLLALFQGNKLKSGLDLLLNEIENNIQSLETMGEDLANLKEEIQRDIEDLKKKRGCVELQMKMAKGLKDKISRLIYLQAKSIRAQQ